LAIISIFTKICLFAQKPKIWSKIEVLVKNRNVCQKIEMLVKNWSFGKKSKFWSKIKSLVQNRNFGQKYKFRQKLKLSSKIEIVIKFCKAILKAVLLNNWQFDFYKIFRNPKKMLMCPWEWAKSPVAVGESGFLNKKC